MDILDCAFHNNDAFLGGAIYTAGVATITQSILYENNAAAAVRTSCVGWRNIKEETTNDSFKCSNH